MFRFGGGSGEYPEMLNSQQKGANPHLRPRCFISFTYTFTCMKAHYNEGNAT